MRAWHRNPEESDRTAYCKSSACFLHIQDHVVAGSPSMMIPLFFGVSPSIRTHPACRWLRLPSGARPCPRNSGMFPKASAPVGPTGTEGFLFSSTISASRRMVSLRSHGIARIDVASLPRSMASPILVVDSSSGRHSARAEATRVAPAGKGFRGYPSSLSVLFRWR